MKGRLNDKEMFPIQEVFLNAIREQERIVRELMQAIRQSDRETRQASIKIYQKKIQDHVDAMKTLAHAEKVKGEESSRLGVEKWAKSLRNKNEKLHLEEIEQATEQLISIHSKAQMDDHDDNFRLDIIRADILADHLYRCMGIYLERCMKADELHMTNIEVTASYMNLTSTAILKKICTRDMSTMMDVIETQQKRLHTFAKKTIAENATTNAETIETLRHMPLIEGGE